MKLNLTTVFLHIFFGKKRLYHTTIRCLNPSPTMNKACIWTFSLEIVRRKERNFRLVEKSIS